jgi:hypothetical protein
MMDPRLAALTVRLQHRHGDGSWTDLRPRESHDPSSSDPERDWADGRIYACPTCDEQVRVVADPAGHERGG